MDAQLARADENTAAILDQFVCVRIVRIWDLDLQQLQFDMNISMAVFVFHPDGTLITRYGSRGSAQRERDQSFEGLLDTLRRSLKVHADLADRKKRKEARTIRKALDGKKGLKLRWRSPGLLPVKGNKRQIIQTMTYKNMRGACMHCHNHREFELANHWRSKFPVEDRLIWGYPMPQTVGFTLDVTVNDRVTAVDEGSAAHDAGLEVGDTLKQINGQMILSIADAQWALHTSPDEGPVEMLVGRDGADRTLTLKLKEGWRRARDVSWHHSNAEGNFILGMILKDTTHDGRKAWKVHRFPPQWATGSSRAALDAGFKEGDIITQFDGRNDFGTARDIILHLLTTRRHGQKVSVTYVRGGAVKKIEVKF